MSMGPPGYKEVLQEGMADVYADDLYLLSDREMGAADTWATAMTLHAGLAQFETEPDIVFAGFKTADGETGHTGPQTAWCLDWPTITHVIAMEVDTEERTVRAKRLVEGDVEEIETVETEMPCFVVTDPEFEPTYRKASHRLRHKELRAETQARAGEIDLDAAVTVWDHEDLNLDPDYIGLDGSPTIVEGVDPIPKAPAEREATEIDAADPEGMEQVFEEIEAYAAGQRAAGD
jgi:electron transfer flavoprotein beta subunit